MRVFKYSQNKVTNFVGNQNILTQYVFETGAGSFTFDLTDSRYIAILNTNTQYADISVTGTDTLGQPFSFNDRIYFVYSIVDQMINNEFAKLPDQIIDLGKMLLTASVTITLENETDTTGLLLAGYFTEFASAMLDGFSELNLDTFVNARSNSRKKYQLQTYINDYQALKRMFYENRGQYFLFAIPSSTYGGFFSEYGRIKMGSMKMVNHDKVLFDIEVER